MLLMCINNEGYENSLIVGKLYTVNNTRHNNFNDIPEHIILEFIGEDGEEHGAYAWRFVDIENIKQPDLNKLTDDELETYLDIKQKMKAIGKSMERVTREAKELQEELAEEYRRLLDLGVE